MAKMLCANCGCPLKVMFTLGGNSFYAHRVGHPKRDCKCMKAEPRKKTYEDTQSPTAEGKGDGGRKT